MTRVVGIVVVLVVVAGLAVGLRLLRGAEPDGGDPQVNVVPRKSTARGFPTSPGNFKGIDVERLGDGGIAFHVKRDQPIGISQCTSGFSLAQELDGQWTPVSVHYFIFKNCHRYVDSGPPPTPAEEQSYCRCEPGPDLHAAPETVTWSGRLVEGNRPVPAPPGRYRFGVPDGMVEFTLP